MAEILIRAIDNVNPDSEMDKGCYKRGHPVVVMPDGHKWGPGEVPPDFYILKITGLTVDDALIYLEEHTSERKRFKLKVPNMNAIESAGGILTIDVTDLPNKFKDLGSG